MDALRLLDSARHKLRLARYHGETLLAVLAQDPPDDPEHELRTALQAHLEGLGYTGTAAAEKTIRSVAPDAIPQHDSIDRMILAARRCELDDGQQAFVGRFESWWVGRGQPTRFAQAARDLRNDAAHAAYVKGPNRARWQMRIRGGRGPIDLDTFARGYLDEVAALGLLVDEAEQLATAAAR